jgi:hypothetical protein
MVSNLKSDFDKLKLFYDVFVKATKGRLKYSGSVFFPFIETTSAKRAEILRSSKINIDYEEFSQNDLNSLIRTKYLMEADCRKCFTLTASGLFHVEEELGLISYEKLLDTIQTKYFDVFESEDTLTDKEKIVLFTLICSRSYSINTCMKLESFGRENELWIEIFRECAKFLKDKHVISSIPNGITQDADNYSVPLMYLMSHINELQKKTNNIYNFTKSRCYYLELEKDGKIVQESLSRLFRKIFNNVLTLSDIECVYEFMEKISSNELMRMSEHMGRNYSKPEIDIILENSLQEAIIGRI